MECYERGILNKTDTDGLDLTFGNVEAQRELIKKIAYREGLGDILAEGVFRAAKQFGRGYRGSCEAHGSPCLGNERVHGNGASISNI
jgi:aldehyde:ferredoxin oxidoreductase